MHICSSSFWTKRTKVGMESRSGCASTCDATSGADHLHDFFFLDMRPSAGRPAAEGTATQSRHFQVIGTKRQDKCATSLETARSFAQRGHGDLQIVPSCPRSEHGPGPWTLDLERASQEAARTPPQNGFRSSDLRRHRGRSCCSAWGRPERCASRASWGSARRRPSCDYCPP